MVRLRALVLPAAVAALLATSLVTTPAKAAGLTAAPNGVAERIGGDDRYLTAIEISKHLGPGADYVLLASGENFPDALAAAPASFTTGSAFAPILLTPKSELRTEVKAEIDRRLDPGDDVWLLGGPAALASNIDAELEAAGYNPRRLTSTMQTGAAPVDRFDTAAAVATEFLPAGQLEEIIVATGLRFPDALAVSAYAAANRVPILLVTSDTIPAATQKFLNERAGPGTTVFVIGGAQAAKAPTAPAGIGVDRIAGTDRFGTAREVARRLLARTAATTQPDDVLVLARADDPSGFADALAGGPLAAAAEGPLVLTNPAELPPTTATFVGSLGYDQPLRPARSFVLGKAAAVSDAVVTAFSEILDNKRGVPGRSSTRRATAADGAITSAVVDARGCNNGTANKADSYTYKDVKIAGDLAGTLTLTGVVACDGAGREAAVVLPSGTAAFTPTGGEAVAGVILGGTFGQRFEEPPPLPLPLPGFEPIVTRPIAVTFALPAAGMVGHLSFVDTETGVVTEGLAAFVTSVSTLPVSGAFASFPNSGCATINFDGALSDATFTMSGLAACRVAATSDVWRIGTGTTGGQFAGEVVGGARRGDVVYLAMRTALGLIDIVMTLDSTLTASSSASAAFLQPLPDTDPAVGFAATAPGADDTGVAGCTSLRTGRDLNNGEVQTPFPGTLKITDLRECRTDTAIGVVEPALGAANPAAKGTRPVCYSHGTDCSFRGRVLGGTFFEDGGNRTIGLTLLIEENNRNGENNADRPGVTMTIVRLTTTVPVAAAGASSEGPVGFAR
jgi:putative cell wall-binding protein